MRLSLATIAMIALISAGLAISPASAQDGSARIDRGTIVSMGLAIKKNLHDGGIHLAASRMADCYAAFLDNPAKMRVCTVWDVALMGLDHNMREMFAGMGVNPGPPPPQLTLEAYQDRRDTFWKMAFPGGDAQAALFIGNAPNEVIDIATRK